MVVIDFPDHDKWVNHNFMLTISARCHPANLGWVAIFHTAERVCRRGSHHGIDSVVWHKGTGNSRSKWKIPEFKKTGIFPNLAEISKSAIEKRLKWGWIPFQAHVYMVIIRRGLSPCLQIMKRIQPVYWTSFQHFPNGCNVWAQNDGSWSIKSICETELGPFCTRG